MEAVIKNSGYGYGDTIRKAGTAMSKLMTPITTLKVEAGHIVTITCVNKKNPEEWSTYRIKIDGDAYKGDGLNNIFLEETTGYENGVDNEKN